MLKRSGSAALLYLFLTPLVLAAEDSVDTEPHDGAISIETIDEYGSPVNGASVLLSREDREEGPQPGPVLLGQTGPDGLVTFTELAIGSYGARVNAGERGAWRPYIYLHRNRKETSVTVEVALHSSICGIVSDVSGAPIPGVVVTNPFGLEAAVSGENGQFAITNLFAANPPGMFTFRREGYGEANVDLTRGPTLLRVILARGGRLAVTVREPDGRPAENVLVRFRGRWDPWQGGVLTDGHGRVPVTWIDAGKLYQLEARRDSDEMVWTASDEVTVPPDEVTELVLNLSTAKKEPATIVRGRAVLASNDQPVQGWVRFGEHRNDLGSYGPTDEDGSFAMRNRERKQYHVLVVPEDPLLYQVGGVAEVDLREGVPVHDLTLRFKTGSGISGTVRASDGRPLRGRYVYAIPEGHVKDRVETRTDEGGHYVAGRLSHPGDTYEIRVLVGDKHRKSQTVKAPAKGRVLEGVDFEFDTALAPVPTYGVVSGRVVDSEGNGIPWALVRLSLSKNQQAHTDDAGRFRLRFEAAGPATVGVTKNFTFQINEVSDGNWATYTVLEGKEIELEEGEKLEGLRIVVEKMAPPPGVIAVVTDEAGAPLNPEVQYSWENGSSSVLHDSAFFAKMPVRNEPSEFTINQRGYQSAVIRSGRDFDRSRQLVHVTLKKGPFPEGVSVFEAVTGEKDTPEGVAALARGGRLKGREDEFRALAAWQPPPPPTVHDVTIVDPSGKPYENVYAKVLRLRSSGDFWTAEQLRWISYAPDADPTALEGENGTFRVTGHIVQFWAEGTAKSLFVADAGDKSAPSTIVLYPASKLRIRAVSHDGAFVHGFEAQDATNIFPLGEAYTPGSEIVSHFEEGWYVIDRVPPGVYDFRVGLEDTVGRIITASVTPGKTYDFEVSLEGPDEQRLRDIVAKTVELRRSPDKLEPYVAGVSTKDRKALARYVTDRLDEMPGRYNWENQRVRACALAAQALNLEETAPAFERAIRRFDAKGNARPRLYELMACIHVLAEVKGDKAIGFFKKLATDEDVHVDARRAGALGLGMLGTEKGRKAFIDLRNAAFGNPNAPERRETYTHAEKIAETVWMVFHGIPDEPATDKGWPVSLSQVIGQARVDTESQTGTTRYQHFPISLERFGTEWIIVDIDATPPPVP